MMSYHSHENDDVRVVKPNQYLKQKVGFGGFDPKAIAQAEKTMHDASKMFPEIAARDLKVITDALTQIESGQATKAIIPVIQAAAFELKSNGGMFKFPLVSEVAQSLFDLCENMTDLPPTTRQVVALHLKSLHLAIAKGPGAVANAERVELVEGLKKACVKALQQEHRD